MTEAPLEALARLETRLEHLHTHSTRDTGDLEDAVKVVRDLVQQLNDAGAPVYGERHLSAFLRHRFTMSEHALLVSRQRLVTALEQSDMWWTRKGGSYALALASYANWNVAVNGDGDAFARLRTARLQAENTLSEPRDGLSDMDRGALLEYQELARAFLSCTEPSAISQWLKDNPEETS